MWSIEMSQGGLDSSDNTACDVLLRLVGEPKTVTNYVRRLGINDLVIANTEKELGRNPAAQYHNEELASQITQ